MVGTWDGGHVDRRPRVGCPVAADPEQRALLRHALFDGDDLSAVMARMAEQQVRTDAAINRLTDRVHALVAAQTQTGARMDELAKAMHELAQQQHGTESRLTELVDVVKGMNDRLGRLHGESFERECRERGHGRFQRVARRLHSVPGDELSVLVDDAEADGRLSGRDAISLMSADAVFSGRSRDDRSSVHVVVEASVTLGHDDVRRARERADLLARVVDTPVLAVVAGEFAPSPVAQGAQDAEVWQVWQGHTIGPADVLPGD